MKIETKKQNTFIMVENTLTGGWLVMITNSCVPPLCQLSKKEATKIVQNGNNRLLSGELAIDDNGDAVINKK